MEVLKIYSKNVVCSEIQEDDDVLHAKFIICDFNTNKNNVKLNRETIENWMGTLKNKPLVGKIAVKQDGTMDFTGHNVKIVVRKDENGNEYQDIEFDTSAFGSFTDVFIEEIDGVEYIVATCDIWTRYVNACNIIKNRIANGTLHTSWEISVFKSRNIIEDGTNVKVIDKGKFIGHALLGSDVAPAYDSSKLLEVAETTYTDSELSNALYKDMVSCSSENKGKEGENSLKDKKKKDNIEVSKLTESDLRRKIVKACEEKIGVWCWIAFHFPVDKTVWVEYGGRESELDYKVFTYTVDENDEVSVSEPVDKKLIASIDKINSKVEELNAEIDKKNTALIKANETIQSLKTEVSELKPYKEKFEKAEQERLEAERKEKQEGLKQYILKSGLVAEEELDTDDFKALIDNLDEVGVKAIIAERFMASIEGNKEGTTETSSVETSTADTKDKNFEVNIVDNGDDETIDHITIMNQYLND